MTPLANINHPIALLLSLGYKKRDTTEVISHSNIIQFDKLEFVSYLTALTVYVAPQLFNTSTDANPASTRASSSCFTVSGVS